MKLPRWATVLVLSCVLARLVAAQDEPFQIFGRVVDAGGNPVLGAQVQAGGAAAKSDAAGKFAVTVKPESEDWMLVVRADGHALFHQDVLPDSSKTEIVVRLSSGRVAPVRVLGEDGRPVRGANVRARLPFAPAYSALERTDFVAVSDQDGVAVLKDLPSTGAIVAEVRAPGMIPAQTVPIGPARQAVVGELPPAETIILTPGRTLRVVVEGPGGQPIAGAGVNLLPLVEPRLDFGGHTAREMTRGAIRAASTDATGAASFELLPADPITCEVRAPGMMTQLFVVEAPKAPGKPMRLRLQPDPSPPGTDVPWRSSAAAAAEESKRTGLPIFLAMSMDGEKANDWMAGHHFHDPEIVRAAREVVPILSNAFGEGGVGESDHREKDGRCTRYGAISCRSHQQIELLAREAVMQTRMAFEVPRHLATTPTGQKLFERVFFLSERDLLRLIVRALRLTSRDAAVRVARERLSSLVLDLASPDAQVRKRSARALALLANSGDEHAAALVQGLDVLEIAPAARLEIAAELHPGAVTAPDVTFTALLRHPDREVRRTLFAAMHELAADETMLDRLATELRSSEGPVREALFRTLEIERKADELRVHDPADANRWRLLEELLDMPEAARFPGLEEALRDVEPPARHRLLRALGRRAPGDLAAQEILIRAIRGPSPVAALRALAPAAAKAKPPNAPLRALLEAAKSDDALVREEALRALASTTTPVDLELLAPSLQHPSRAVALQAALALWRRGDRRGHAILLAAVSDLELGSEAQAALREGR